MKSKLKIINDVVSWILLIAVTICLVFSLYSVYQAKTTGEPAFLFGYRPILVLTGSMEPYMMTNSIAITEEVDSMEDIAVGDVVTYRVKSEGGKTLNITHRIIQIDEDGFILTKGDNNHVSDNIVLTIDNIDAKVVTVFNQTAWIAAKWQTTSGKIMLISFAVGIVLFFFTLRFGIAALIDKFRKKKEIVAEPDAPVAEESKKLPEETGKDSPEADPAPDVIQPETVSDETKEDQ